LMKHDRSKSRLRRLAFHSRLHGSYFHSRSTGILIAAEATGDNQITDNVEAQFFLTHISLRAADIAK
jgi:hypothetical protein